MLLSNHQPPASLADIKPPTVDSSSGRPEFARVLADGFIKNQANRLRCFVVVDDW